MVACISNLGKNERVMILQLLKELCPLLRSFTKHRSFVPPLISLITVVTSNFSLDAHRCHSTSNCVPKVLLSDGDGQDPLKKACNKLVTDLETSELSKNKCPS